MNNSLKSNNSEEIGIDPTTVEIIDVLDLSEGPSQNKKPKSKFQTMITKILFTFGVILLMASVSFGIYFYLNMGKKKAEETKSFNLENQKVYVGAELSDSVFDYGDFEKVDVTGCSIDKSKVDTSKAGEYEYSMVCDGAKYTAKIEVVDKFEFEITTKAIYKSIGSNVNASEFIEGKENYTYEFNDEKDVQEKLYKSGGPYQIEINISDNKGKKGKAYGYLFVTDSVSANYLTCEIATSTSSGTSYIEADTFTFDSFRNNLNLPSRTYTFYKLKEEDYLDYINNKMKDGRLAIGDFDGYALRDDKNTKLSILIATTTQEINSEAGSDVTSVYSSLEEYYTSKGFKCSK